MNLTLEVQPPFFIDFYRLVHETPFCSKGLSFLYGGCLPGYIYKSVVEPDEDRSIHNIYM